MLSMTGWNCAPVAQSTCWSATPSFVRRHASRPGPVGQLTLRAMSSSCELICHIGCDASAAVSACCRAVGEGLTIRALHDRAPDERVVWEGRHVLVRHLRADGLACSSTSARVSNGAIGPTSKDDLRRVATKQVDIPHNPLDRGARVEQADVLRLAGRGDLGRVRVPEHREPVLNGR
jgi:hypothetical protein